MEVYHHAHIPNSGKKTDTNQWKIEFLHQHLLIELNSLT
jgi:hypothetical protein